MPKQEYKIQSFHGGSNNKFDPRDIEDNQNAFSALSITNPGRLTLEGSAMTLYDKTDINGKTVNDITGNLGFKAGHGLFSFSHDYDMESTPDEIDTEFIALNDGADIDIYDPNQSTEWQEAKFKLGSRTATVKPSYYNVDGALRVCDSNFGVTTTGYQTNKNPHSKNDVTITMDTGSAVVETGSVIQINQEIMYVTAGCVASGTSLSVVRGFANTKIAVHADNSVIYYVNVPRYFGHIKQDRLFEADTSDSINAWTLDVQTPQSPNNTRSGVSFKTTSELVQDGAVSASAGSGWAVAGGWSYDTGNDKLTYDGTTDASTLTQTFTSSLYAGSVYTFRFTVATDTLQLTFKDSADNTLVAIAVYAVGTHFITLTPTVDTATLKIIAGNTDEDAASIVGSTAVSCTELECAQSAGVQALRIYDEVTSSTTNFPTESEKVVLEFGDNAPDYGITEVDIDEDEVTITTSANHGLTNGDEIVISNIDSDISKLAGTHTVQTDLSDTEFTLIIEDHGISEKDWSTSTNFAQIDTWTDYKDTVAGTVRATIDASEVATGQTWIHITGVTGATSYNGVKLTTYASGTTFYFKDANHGDVGSANTGSDIKAQELLGTITRPGEDAIDEDLKRKWNFAMSFTYDGPGQEVQESLLTQGYKITESVAEDGTANELAEALETTTENSGIAIDDADGVLVVNDIIMVGTEQMLVTAVSSNEIGVTRGYNNSTAATHSSGDQILLVEELTQIATVDWTGETVAKKAVIKTNYDHGASNKTWNPRINGFKIYMRDVTDGDASKEWRLFSHVNFNKGTYILFAADDSELILEQPASGTLATITTGTEIKIKPIDTYLSENLFTEETIIDAQYKAVEVVGRRAYIGNIRQGGRTYPDRMLRTPVNKFDTFPETNYIDVAVGDGDSITALKSYGDRLLQFKKNKVYIINVAGESEVLEAEYNNAGISFPSQVTKTNDGIAWINDSGLWYFDGKQVQNLTLHIEDNGYSLGSLDLTSPKIGFDKKSNRIIFSPKIAAGQLSAWYIYDLNLKSYQAYYVGELFPFSESAANYYTNMINDSNGDLILGYVDGASTTKTELNFYVWDNTEKGQMTAATSIMHKTKDIDFGSPGVRKKIYKVYVTYRCSGHSGVKLLYETDGGKTNPLSIGTALTGTFKDSTNYISSAGGFQSTSASTNTGQWKVAELKPSSSINNIKSIQLSFDAIGGAGTVASTGDAETIQLASGLGSTDYDEYNVFLYTGPARYNSRRITGYNTSNQTATVAAMTDRGYTNVPTGDTKYVMPAIASDFEINDITIVYRMKRVK